MIAIQLKINGSPLYTAGVEDWDSLHAILSIRNSLRGQAPSFDLNIGGACQSDLECRGDTVRWAGQYLSINDEITITIVETDAVDPPIKRLKREQLEEKYDPQFTEEELEAMDLELYRKLKSKYEKSS